VSAGVERRLWQHDHEGYEPDEHQCGQQLMDLEKAHNEGIISDKEYAKLKKSIVQKND
jgi:hypothetical protein